MIGAQLGKKRTSSNSEKDVKRSKFEGNDNSIISRKLLTQKSIEKLKQSKEQSSPYQYLHIRNIFNEKLLRKAQEEAKYNLTAEFKESDLFKVYQTIDLGNLTDEDKRIKTKLKNLFKLKEYLYSEEFRHFVSSITGAEDLTDRTDCSMNIYTEGCHLLCHDDVIGTRKVSYIIYLTDPDVSWEATDGGALELYPLDNGSIVRTIEGKRQGIPTAVPSKLLLPLYNSMVIFNVQPGMSYHAVQEVYADKTRMSISGWYHGSTAPPGADLASLKLIMSRGDDAQSFSPLYSTEVVQTTDTAVIKDDLPIHHEIHDTSEAPSAADNVLIQKPLLIDVPPALSPTEWAFLREYINPDYFAAHTIAEINHVFCDQSSLQLKDFLRADLVQCIKKLMESIDANDKLGHGSTPNGYTVGETEIWSVVGPAHKRRYLQYKSSDLLAYVPIASLLDSIEKEKELTTEHSRPQMQLGHLLSHLDNFLFRTDLFAKYLHFITSLQPLSVKSEIRRFRPGLDYTVAHYGGMSIDPRLDATLCFVAADVPGKELVDAGVTCGGYENNSSTESSRDIHQRERDDSVDVKGPNSSDEEGNSDSASDSGNSAHEEAVWDSGDVGGFECYIEADDAAEVAEAAEVFQSGFSTATASKKGKSNADEAVPDIEGEGEGGYTSNDNSLLSISPGFNVLNLVMRDDKIMRFIKYLSAKAPSSRLDVSVEYEFKH